MKWIKSGSGLMFYFLSNACTSVPGTLVSLNPLFQRPASSPRACGIQNLSSQRFSFSVSSNFQTCIRLLNSTWNQQVWFERCQCHLPKTAQLCPKSKKVKRTRRTKVQALETVRISYFQTRVISKLCEFIFELNIFLQIYRNECWNQRTIFGDKTNGSECDSEEKDIHDIRESSKSSGIFVTARLVRKVLQKTWQVKFGLELLGILKVQDNMF